ncbi:type II secretion system minor pseudopilin GspK [Duganella sp. CT11-25]|jgi:general secretion pathway protein K|uniref:type II secretion system minor pseudopilin GspK n=1 Tax=unclassified Duganella TaxID=2636909 RepID=UPI0039AFB65E
MMPRMPRRQRGVAVITALLLTTLAVTIVASLFWQQQVQVRSMENQRLQLQTRWILRGALDLSRLILNQDFMDAPNFTQLNGIWATPLEETRLDDYIERERLQGESFNATLSGKMVDAQSRYNLANLASGKKINTDELAVFERLLANLKLDSNLAPAAASLVANAQKAVPAAASGTGTGGTVTQQNPSQSSGGAEPMDLVRVEDLLAVSGFTPQAIEQLRDYVIILPSATPVNVNTAPAELVAALVPNLSLSDAAAVVSSRNRGLYYRDVSGFTSVAQVAAALRATAGVAMVTVAVKSNYFLAFSRVRLDRASLDTQSLLSRPGTPNTSVVWIREN